MKHLYAINCTSSAPTCDLAYPLVCRWGKWHFDCYMLYAHLAVEQALALNLTVLALCLNHTLGLE